MLLHLGRGTARSLSVRLFLRVRPLRRISTGEPSRRLPPRVIVSDSIFAVNGLYHVHFSVVWLAGVLGVITPDALRTGWHLPRRWRAPLVCWAACALATTPMIALRAVGFQPELLFRTRLETEALGGFPLLTITWIIHVALLLAIGVLVVRLAVRPRREVFRALGGRIPLASSAALLGAAACYQLFVDVGLPESDRVCGLGRASGTCWTATSRVPSPPAGQADGPS